MSRWAKIHLAKGVEYLFYAGFRREMDIYEFGAYRGESLALIEDLFYCYQIPYRKAFGFDSFEGLPEEAEGVPKHGYFDRGGFAWRGAMFPTRNATFIKGWFVDLGPPTVRQYDLLPASFVHIDSDLYLSAYQALDFLFGQQLIVPGTVVCYDEFLSTPRLWQGGESRAHREIADKYRVTFREVFRHTYEDTSLFWQNTFVVDSIGQRADPGVST
jgi:hypothetical protein